MKLKNSKKGFTLVELVIVIAVIAILAAVLIPVFSTVVKDAKRTAAISNANTFKEGIIIETQDTFDAYCEAIVDSDAEVGHEHDSECTATVKIIDDLGNNGKKIGDYITDVKGDITIKYIEEADGVEAHWEITYTTSSGNVVTITATGVVATK